MIRFQHAWALLALPVLALVVVRLRAMPRGSAWRRGAAWLALVVALAGPEVVGPGAREPVVLAVPRGRTTPS